MFDGVRAIGRWIGSIFDRISHPNVFTLCDGVILRGDGVNGEDRVVIADIAAWWLVHEMIFDIVVIVLKDESWIQWLDYHNDLIAILETHAKDERREASEVGEG